jgi:hypothetical protein
VNSINKPNISQFGLSPLRILWGSDLWNNGVPLDEPDMTIIEALAKKLTPNVPVCIDIENWDNTGKRKDVMSSIAKLSKVFAKFHAVQPNAKVGIYSFLPVRDYQRAIGLYGTKRKDEWLRENLALKPLASSVDIVFPSLYTFDGDYAGWKKYAIENIKEARKYGRPVYVFLMPVYHPAAKLAGQYLPADFWRLQLETCRQYADGVVIYHGSKTLWDDNAPWWLETVKFLQSRK